MRVCSSFDVWKSKNCLRGKYLMKSFDDQCMNTYVDSSIKSGSNRHPVQ